MIPVISDRTRLKSLSASRRSFSVGKCSVDNESWLGFFQGPNPEIAFISFGYDYSSKVSATILWL